MHMVIPTIATLHQEPVISELLASLYYPAYKLVYVLFMLSLVDILLVPMLDSNHNYVH